MKPINPSLILYFLSYILYLFFFKIVEDKEIMLLFKPIILVSISYYYITYSKVDKNYLHFVILVFCFVSDNMNLLGEVYFHRISIVLYLMILFVFLYLIVKDSKLLKKGSAFEKYFGVGVFVVVLLFLVAKLTSTFLIKTKFHHYYLILNYIALFVSVLFLSFYNFFKRKTISSKFLVCTLLALFFSDLFAVINSYYFPFKPLVYLSCLAEIPSYYFLVKYFINRDKETLYSDVVS